MDIDDYLTRLSKELGGPNWVIHRRTQRIVQKYGPDVVCVTPRRYEEAVAKVMREEKEKWQAH